MLSKLREFQRRLSRTPAMQESILIKEIRSDLKRVPGTTTYAVLAVAFCFALALAAYIIIW